MDKDEHEGQTELTEKEKKATKRESGKGFVYLAARNFFNANIKSNYKNHCQCTTQREGENELEHDTQQNGYDVNEFVPKVAFL